MEDSRMRRLVVMLPLALILTALPAAAHMGPAEPAKPAPSEPAKPAIRVQRVGEGAWCLLGSGGNIGVVVSPSAVLVVDDQFEKIAPAIHDEIKKLSSAPLRYVVNTHYHFDHTGGNAYFGKMATLVGHENVRGRLYTQPAWALANLPSRLTQIEGLLGGKRKIEPAYAALLKGRQGLYKAFLDAAQGFKAEEVVAPAITFDEGMTLFLDDEEVRIFHVAPGHTDGDAIVWFPKRKVVHMGDLFVAGFPFIDVDGGGASEGWLKNLDAVLSRIPDDTRVIPGHGEVAGVVELKRFRAYVSDLRGAVAAAVKSGQSLEEAVRDIKLERYADFKPGFMSLGMNVGQVWTEMGGKPDLPASR
jgi:glyoxylase-like metal-dependent hydrolase (beta-lactamase superfamily II)